MIRFSLNRRLGWVFAIATVVLLVGCAKDKTPNGPDNGVPIFRLEAETPIIGIGQDTALRLTPVLPLDFENLSGQWVWFTCTPDSGTFTANPSNINLSMDGFLNPKCWFLYTGYRSNVNISLYAWVITLSQDTLAWDSCSVRIE
jgi:hypothetical protein